MKNKQEENYLFEIKDNVYIIEKMTEVGLGLGLLFYIFVLGKDFGNDSLYGTRTMIIISILALISGLTSLYFYKQRKIVFYKNKVLKYTGENYLELDEINEIYKVPLYHMGYSYRGIKRQSIFRLIILFLFLPIFILFWVIPSYMVHLIFFREKLKNKFRLVLIGKLDSENIVINYSSNNKKEEEQVKNYFQKYYHIDISTLKTQWFYLPNKKRS